jgi:hypothetical protein
MPLCTNIRQYHGKGVQVVDGQKEKNVFRKVLKNHIYLFLQKKEMIIQLTRELLAEVTVSLN